jgi:hypothetical protein
MHNANTLDGKIVVATMNLRCALLPEYMDR